MILYRLFFCPRVGEITPNPTRRGCRAQHTGIYYRQTSPLTAFFPFMDLKEGKAGPKQSLIQHYPEGDGAAPAPSIPLAQTEDGGVLPHPKMQPQNRHTQLACESNTSGAASTRSHLVPAVDSASAGGKENVIECWPGFLLQATTPEVLKKLAWNRKGCALKFIKSQREVKGNPRRWWNSSAGSVVTGPERMASD